MNYVGIDAAQVNKHTGEHLNMTVDKLYDFLSGTMMSDQNYRLVFEETSPVGLIIKVTGDLDADLIVVGTHSLFGVRKVMLGSVAEGVLRKAHSNVLAVPPKA